MGLIEALLLIIIVILLAQFMPGVLYLGAISAAVIGGILVAAIAGLLLWQTLGPDNLSLIIGGAFLALLPFGAVWAMVDFYRLPLADPPIDPNSGQPLRSPRYVGKVATAVVAIIAGLLLGLIVGAIIQDLVGDWLTYDQKKYAQIAHVALMLIAPIPLYFWFRDLYARREKQYWWRKTTMNMENHVPSRGLDEYLARRDKSPVDAD